MSTRFIRSVAILCSIAGSIGCRGPEQSQNSQRTVTVYVSTDRVFSEPVLREYEKRSGIRVNTVNPVVTLTPMAIKAWSDPAKAQSMLARIPMGRFVEPEEVADTILYLLSPRASMVTGSSITADGGFRAR